MVDNFRVVINIKKTILYLDKIIVNFPGNEKVIKDKISNINVKIKSHKYVKVKKS